MDAPMDQQGYLNIPFGKAILRMTPTEYANAVKRGKAYLRTTALAAREAQLGAEREAETLAWIVEEG